MYHVDYTGHTATGEIMKVLLYAGPAPSRDTVLQFSAQIVQYCATSLTLVTGGGAERRPLLEEACARLAVPASVPVTFSALPGNAQTAILMAAHAQSYDLVILGRLHQPLGRLLPGAHSKVIAQRLEPSVLRVHGPTRPIRRILLASGGDFHTFGDVKATAQIAKPLRAAVAMLNEHGVPAQMRGRAGPVIDEILSELRVGSYDLLVIGAHRVASALDRILLEDITDDLLDISPLPVLLVKSDQRRVTSDE